MNESILERIQSSAKSLKIDLYTAELASYADEKELTPEALEAVCGVFEYLEQKKYDSMVHTMLKLSKLPMNEPKTFERFDFSRLPGKHVQSLKNLSSLSALYECCLKGYKTYFLRASELNQKLTDARKHGREGGCHQRAGKAFLPDHGENRPTLTTLCVPLKLLSPQPITKNTILCLPHS